MAPPLQPGTLYTTLRVPPFDRHFPFTDHPDTQEPLAHRLTADGLRTARLKGPPYATRRGSRRSV